MKIVFNVGESEKPKLQDVLDEDPIARLSISQKSSETIDVDAEGIFVMLDGDDEVCEQAREKLSEFGEELQGTEKEEVIEAIEAAEKEAAEGFGSIFGG
ncbi:MAG: hypothetical protein ACLFQ8_00680 [Candidatus Aenigmatarchaeota archaeon]